MFLSILDIIYRPLCITLCFFSICIEKVLQFFCTPTCVITNYHECTSLFKYYWRQMTPFKHPICIEMVDLVYTYFLALMQSLLWSTHDPYNNRALEYLTNLLARFVFSIDTHLTLQISSIARH